jgi:predicted alpha/beta hydrolase
MTPPAEPAYFGPAPRPLAGWLHRADPERAVALGVVIVGPFGYEAICAHRSVRHLAQASAAAGFAALRFDLDGTGDSAGDDRDPDRVAAWITSVGHAIDAVRRHAGVERVCVVGIRLGALLAARATTGRSDVVGLAAVAPVVAGKAYLRELRALQMALGLGTPPSDAVVDPDVQEAIGFPITAATKAALSAIDLARDASAPAPAVLILDRDDLPVADAWAARLAGAGVAVQAERAPGYVEMAMDPHKAVVPEALWTATTRWIALRAAALGLPPASGAGEPTVRAAAVGASVEERVAVVDDAVGLVGVVSAPRGVAPSGRALVLLNAGAIHHVGPNRLYVAFARRWAAAGDLVLRLDGAGLGDSPPRPGEPENVVYGDHAVDDVARAVAWLHRQPGVRAVHAIGLCSGAYHAFKAAVAGLPLASVVPINPLTFFWKPGTSLDFPRFRVASAGERYTRSVFHLDKWRKVLRGEVQLRAVAQTMGRYAAARLTDRARDVSRRIGMPWKEDLGAELEAIARLRIALRFVFAADDPGIPLLRSQGGSVVPQLAARGLLPIEIIAGPDHTFTPLWSHPALWQALDTALART